MFFSDFEKLSEISNKQRINISERTKSILLSDMNVFHIDKESVSTIKADAGNLPSYIVNHIFRCYRNIAHASIEQTLASEKNELINVLEEMDEAQRKKAVECLLKKRREELKTESSVRKARKGFSFTFNVDNENIEYLKSEYLKSKEAQGEKNFYKDFYDDNVGSYIKTVLEEYADLPYVEREKIFCTDVLKTINADLNEEKAKVIKLHLYSKTNVNGKLQETIVYMEPYGVRKDSESLYNYVVGMTKRNTEDSKWSVGAIRLTSIRKCECLSSDATISEKDRKKIESKIKTQGVQYLSAGGEIQKIIVLLDWTGEKMYNRMLHLRPMYINKNRLDEHDDKTFKFKFEFECTLSQAEFYFFKFGHHAKIIEPKELAELFRQKYISAAEQYEKEQET